LVQYANEINSAALKSKNVSEKAKLEEYCKKLGKFASEIATPLLQLNASTSKDTANKISDLLNQISKENWKLKHTIRDIDDSILLNVANIESGVARMNRMKDASMNRAALNQLLEIPPEEPEVSSAPVLSEETSPEEGKQKESKKETTDQEKVFPEEDKIKGKLIF
jgi:hypothetical protein